MHIRRRVLYKLIASATFMTFVVACVGFLTAQSALAAGPQLKKLPTEIADTTFWRMISEFSESEQPFNTFMVSNETRYPILVTSLLSMRLKGGAYIGVAPEQNYHYIAALRPQIAFIIDIRRQAIIQHLMFKAAFELSPTRADFISTLFAKGRPPGLATNASARQNWQAFWYVKTDTAYTRYFQRIYGHLKGKHNFPLSNSDSAALDYTFECFFSAGPNIVQNCTSANEASPITFANLTSAVDLAGNERSFLANEEGYDAVRQLHLKNLIVPVVGDFAGAHALRSIGNYLLEHNAQLTAFYISNVDEYLLRDGKLLSFRANVASLPFHSESVILRGVTPTCNIYVFVTSGC